MAFELLTILGPTASGKTSIATRLAARLDGEIISADSRQVYRRMDIGTGKDLSDYIVKMPDGSVVNVPYHLTDICEPGTKYNLFRYQEDFHIALEGIKARGKLPVMCGGTGLYIESVLKGYELSPVEQNAELRKSLEGKSLEELTRMLENLKERNGSHMHNHTDVDTKQRAIRAIEIETHNLEHPTPLRAARKPESLIIGVDIERNLRREKITARLKTRLEEGMVDEVRGLLAEGIAPEDLIYYGLEYKFLTLYITGVLSYDEMVRQLEIAIHQFAKRQMTWFRGMERRGFNIKWVKAPANADDIDATVEEIITLWKEGK